MELLRVFLLLIGICCVILVRQTHAKCCIFRKMVLVSLNSGRCADVGGISKLKDAECYVNICPDGTPRKGFFCGRGSCNFFGCGCEGGCRTGGGTESYLKNYEQYGIQLMQEW